jgi:hypothetical protein
VTSERHCATALGWVQSASAWMWRFVIVALGFAGEPTASLVTYGEAGFF